MMHVDKDLKIVKQLFFLIRTQASGPPSRLAAQLGISERSLYRHIRWLRTHGIPIRYNRYRACYECDQETHVRLHMEISVICHEQAQHILFHHMDL